MAPELQALPLSNFLVSWWMGCQFVGAVFTALLGIWGIGQMTPGNAHKKTLFWVLFGLAVGLAALGCWQNAEQLQQADLDKRVAEQRIASISDSMTKLASAINVKKDESPAQIVEQAIKLLPKAFAVDVTGGTGNLVGNSIGQQTINAANGIASIGGTLINPQVTNNLGSPPAKLTHIEKLIAQSGKTQVMEVHISTDRTIKSPSIGFTLSKSFNATDEYWKTHAPRLDGHPAMIYNWGAVRDANKNEIPNSFGIVMDNPSTFSPGMDLVITMETSAGAQVTSLAELH